ncbi:hypothetical protein IE53DRAFT_149600 [Violaceomyces palustris]|uniref:Uncharacterized protein n=1 Tax=Violaceomyces palustris TaxID=1673888 RepID=A0ACD0P698_9BASI|nr:hypothetical protein IE53DRAFT_149600 [Violaceomyces palustris]
MGFVLRFLPRTPPFRASPPSVTGFVPSSPPNPTFDWLHLWPKMLTHARAQALLLRSLFKGAGQPKGPPPLPPLPSTSQKLDAKIISHFSTSAAAANRKVIQQTCSRTKPGHKRLSSNYPLARGFRALLRHVEPVFRGALRPFHGTPPPQPLPFRQGFVGYPVRQPVQPSFRGSARPKLSTAHGAGLQLARNFSQYGGRATDTLIANAPLAFRLVGSELEEKKKYLAVKPASSPRRLNLSKRARDEQAVAIGKKFARLQADKDVKNQHGKVSKIESLFRSQSQSQSDKASKGAFGQDSANCVVVLSDDERTEDNVSLGSSVITPIEMDDFYIYFQPSEREPNVIHRLVTMFAIPVDGDLSLLIFNKVSEPPDDDGGLDETEPLVFTRKVERQLDKIEQICRSIEAFLRALRASQLFDEEIHDPDFEKVVFVFNDRTAEEVKSLLTDRFGKRWEWIIHFDELMKTLENADQETVSRYLCNLGLSSGYSRYRSRRSSFSLAAPSGISTPSSVRSWLESPPSSEYDFHSAHEDHDGFEESA